MNFKLKSTEGEEIVIENVPTSLKDIKLSTKIAFDEYDRKLKIFQAEEVEKGTILENGPLYMYHVAQCATAFYKHPITDFLKLDISDYLKTSTDLKLDVLKDNVKIDYSKYDFESVEDTLMSLYHWAKKICGSHVFTFAENGPYSFVYEDEVWESPGVIATTFTGKKFTKISTRQGVEILQTKKYLKSVLDSNQNIKVRMDNLFTNFMRIIALSARKEGEEVPLDETEFELFIEDRVKHFTNIDASTGLDIVFFSLIISKNSSKIQSIVDSLASKEKQETQS